MRSAALLTALALAVGLGACGNSDAGSGEAATPRLANPTPLKVSADGSAQFHVKGGDNSVQDYGEEADEAELGEAARIVHSFYVARAAGEWARACSLLAQSTIDGFEKLTEANPQLQGKGCAGVLNALTKPVSASLQRQLTMVDAHALRHEGEQGFLIYTSAPPGVVYAMPLRLEGGEWKVAALSAAALPGAS